MKRRLMVIGAGPLQVPAIIKGKELGLEVIAIDMDPNAPGTKFADKFFVINTIDIPTAVLKAKELRIDGVMTLATDMPMRTVAAIARELNIVGVSEDTALKATNKVLMRECLHKHNVPIPRFFKVNDYKGYLIAIQQFRDKFIVKPADNSGSRGVFLVKDINDKETITYAYEYSKKNSYGGEIVVEEFMEGAEVSVETISLDGKVYVIAITDKLTTGAPSFVEMGHSQPSCLSDTIKEQIKAVATAAVKAIGIENGPSHTEIIVTAEGPKIVELGARLGGDNITTHLVPLSTGVDMVKCCIEIALGQKPDLERKINMGSAIRYLEASIGRIDSIKGIDKAEKLHGVKQISIVKNIGDTVGEINCSSDRIGFVIAQVQNVKKAIKMCEKVIDRITIQVV